MDGNSKVTIDRIFEIYEGFLSDDLTVKLRNFLKSIGKLETIIQNIHEAMNEDEKEIKRIYEKERIEHEKLAIQEVRDNIAKYNQIVLLLLQCQDREIINLNVNKLMYHQKCLSHFPELFKPNDGINLKTIKYTSAKDIIITLSKNGNTYKMKLLNSNYVEKTTYLFPGEELQDNNFKKGIPFRINEISDTFFNFIYEQYCDTNSDLSHLINKNIICSKKIPEIVFGKNCENSTTFINILNTLNNDLKSLNKNFFQKIESKQVIENNDFNFIKKIEDTINQRIRPNLCVIFTDCSECPKTRFILENDLRDFLYDLLSLLSNFNQLTQKELYPAQKILKSIIKEEERKKEEEGKKHQKEEEYKEKLQSPKNEFAKQMNEFENQMNQMKLMFEQMKLCLQNEMEDKNKEFQKKLDEKDEEIYRKNEEIQRLTEQLKILQKQHQTTTNENFEKK